MTNPDLIIEKPYAEIRSIPMKQLQNNGQDETPRIRFWRSSPGAMTFQVRLPKAKTLMMSNGTVTIEELRQMLAYAEAQWPDKYEKGS